MSKSCIDVMGDKNVVDNDKDKEFFILQISRYETINIIKRLFFYQWDTYSIILMGSSKGRREGPGPGYRMGGRSSPLV